MAILETTDLKKYYGSGENITKALDGISLKIEEGEFVAIVGVSGSGKSTLLNMIGGLDIPTSGNVLVKGKNIGQLNEEELTIFRRRNIGFVFQNYNLIPILNVYENIVFPVELDGNEVEQDFLDKIITILGIDKKLENLPSDLSGGQQQRVGIARALAASPEILLMDEPFGAVDEITRGQLQIELKQIHKKTGITVLFVTHDISEALKLGTKVLVMDKGQVQQYAKPDDLLRNPNTDFVKQLVDKERRTCYLPDERLEDCEYSGAGNK